MNTLKNLVLIIFIFSYNTAPLPAQVQSEDLPMAQSINEGSVSDQFEYAIKKSNNYNDSSGRSYEVIKRSMFLNLKKNTLDSLGAIQARLDNSISTVSKQKKEIDLLKADLEKTQNSLTSTMEEKDSMSLFGIPMSKISYGILMWSIIGALLALLLIFIFKFKNSNLVTNSAKSALSDLENEFIAHKRTALEREQKVKRQLQDEINKHAR